MKQKIRNLAISLLDDENGINAEAYEQLQELLIETGNDDICNATNASDNRVFIGENDAEVLRG